MKRQFGIFLIGSIILLVFGLTYTSQVVAYLTVFYPTSVDISGAKIVLTPKDMMSSPEKYQLVAQDTGRIVAKRLDQLQITGYYQINIKDNSHVEVIIPPVEDMPYLLNLITRIGQVEFIDGGVNPPIGEQVDTTRSSADNEAAYKTLFVGNEINTVIPPDAQTGEIFYQLELAAEAAERFSTFDAQKTDAHVCLVIDKEVINCSKVYYWSDNTLDIMPKLSSGTGLGLADLAVLLNSGPLPAALDVSVE